MYYYISDLHFGHENVIRFDGRPFDNVDDMELWVKSRWNSKIKNSDTVFILGDFSFEKTEKTGEILRSLNGKKVLIIGNHDKSALANAELFEKVTPYLEVVDPTCKRKVVLSHYPIPFYNCAHKQGVMLYGHVHNTVDWKLTEEIKKIVVANGVPCAMYNTGCMLPHMNYEPQTLKYIMQNDKGWREC